MQAKACKEIVTHGLDDTFYIVDLANTLRMYKVQRPPSLSLPGAALVRPLPGDWR